MSEVISLEKLQEGPKQVTIDGKKYLVCQVSGEVHVYRNICPHQYGPAIEGRIDKEKMTVTCPWHGFEFDLNTGNDPLYGKSLPELAVTVKNGKVYIK